ncbi:fungal-specific transcription factor domain-domain-containing protein [Microdochium bolleyi]|uniref:Fungal-specific transcription factor domain-domain-containing protein n=1 Tax=Microdochium bolleyi TaxID=196109 RepID=A0A136J638_9PEZI|nr:fungal-specific transcription factor domain-domain-containing protein [Microdochium bolleyi]
METSPISSGKVPRVLACVLCQTRKIKCDRNSPCANCIKANVKCTPSTPAPARKRRRPNQDLQQRLARCEELLSEYATKKPDENVSDGSDGQEPWRPLGQLIIDDGGGVKFMDSYLCANIHEELRAMREILDDEDKDDDYSTPKYDPSTNASSPDLNTGLILTDNGTGNVENLHPQTAHVIQLWQTFLERINPLTKIIHVPSLQPLVAEAATHPMSMPKNVEALLFSIYLMAAVSMSDEECLLRLGYSKVEAVERFSRGVRLTLMKIGILRFHDMVVLQALVFFMLSLSGRYDRHAAWILNGTIVRIAQKMGLHRDGENFGLSPFESELRRRIWWQIVMLDAVYALMSGLGQSLLPRGWNTRKPSNLTDADLFPSMTTITPRETPTDMVYCLISYEMGKLLTESSTLEVVIMRNERATTDPANDGDIDKARKRIDEVDDIMTQILDQHYDPSLRPVHQLAKDSKAMFMTKLRELVCPPQEQPEWGTEVFTAKDNLFKVAVTTGEHNMTLYRSVRANGPFLWIVMTHFQIEVLIYMVGQLSIRRSGQLVDRAWAVIDASYTFNTGLLDLTNKAHLALAIHTLRAWKVRRVHLQETTGASPQTPSFIINLETLLPKHDSQLNSPASGMSTQFPPQALATTGGGGVLNQMMFVDATGPMDWNMFGGPHGTNVASDFGPLGTDFGVTNDAWT